MMTIDESAAAVDALDRTERALVTAFPMLCSLPGLLTKSASPNKLRRIGSSCTIPWTYHSS